MKKIVLLILLAGLLFKTYKSEAQPCSGGGNITLTSQADIDNFQATYGPCNQVNFSLQILDGGDPINDITNLDGLIGLSQVIGTLSIGPLTFLR